MRDGGRLVDAARAGRGRRRPAVYRLVVKVLDPEGQQRNTRIRSQFRHIRLVDAARAGRGRRRPAVYRLVIKVLDPEAQQRNTRKRSGFVHLRDCGI